VLGGPRGGCIEHHAGVVGIQPPAAEHDQARTRAALLEEQVQRARTSCSRAAAHARAALRPLPPPARFSASGSFHPFFAAYLADRHSDRQPDPLAGELKLT
jgi:hypothetical protein